MMGRNVFGRSEREHGMRAQRLNDHLLQLRIQCGLCTRQESRERRTPIGARLRIHAGVFNLAGKKHWDWADLRGRLANDAAIDRYAHGVERERRRDSAFLKAVNTGRTMNRYLFIAILCSASVFAADEPPAKPAGARYTFSWQLDGTTLQPRGGTTKGAATTLDRDESAAWKKLHEPGSSALERDRNAIRAMAGTYKVSFDFLEIVPFGTQGKPNPPYQSWGTEKVYVDVDDGQTISLVHILEMRIVQADGSISEPMVTKHWRHDWQYQPSHIVEYRGRERWERRKLKPEEARGAWSQTVYQVDESPRYSSVGRWQHSDSFSTWLSGDTWRPLPRREWSVRDDYQVLIGTNRHTIAVNGWVQEENNLKAVLPENAGAVVAYKAREYGVARYERIRDADFAAADEYYAKTRQFWDQVRDEWSSVFEKQGGAKLKGPVDKLGLFKPLFSRADDIQEKGAGSPEENTQVIRAAFKEMGALKN